MLQIQVWEVFIIGESSSTLHIRTDVQAMMEGVLYNIFGEKAERSSNLQQILEIFDNQDAWLLV